MDKQFTAKSHYVPKFYLRYWSKDGTTVQVYRTVVKTKSDDLWKSYSIKSIPKIKDLYTSLSDNSDCDSLENWFNTKIEAPASVVIQNIINDKHLSKEQYDILIRYAAAQIVRTPKFYLKSEKFINDNFNDIASEGIKASEKQIENYTDKELLSALKRTNSNLDNQLCPIQAHLVTNTQSPYVKVEALTERKMWQYNITHLLTSTEKILHNHKWSIIKAPSGFNWATSDDPVLCLNYRDEKHYDFNGGWGRKNCDIIFPLTPDYLMFTEVGNRKTIKQFNLRTCLLIQQMIIEHAFLYVFSKDPIKGMCHFHPRKTDINLYNEKVGIWENWGDYQRNIERIWNNSLLKL